ncbi:hypothetical protein, partial [Pseudomonas graminis]|uniref:hypothetical protein n=1 Tax=Pseudomonas graminis TaxID=158627 RepID=UPI001C314003
KKGYSKEWPFLWPLFEQARPHRYSPSPLHINETGSMDDGDLPLCADCDKSLVRPPLRYANAPEAVILPMPGIKG